MIASSLMAWGRTFQQDIFDFSSPSTWVAWGLVVICAVVVILYLTRLESRTERKVSALTDDRARWTKQAIMIGSLAIILGGFPIWFANRHVNFDINSDANRFTLGMMFGACILLVGLIQLTIKSQWQRIVILGIVAGLAVGFHFRNANRFRRDWLAQKSLFWQLSWRAPGLKPGTSILVDAPPLMLALDNTLTSPVNFIYAPQHSSAQLDYWAYLLPRDLGKKIPSLAENVSLKGDHMNYLSFTGSTSNSLVVWFSPPSCLRVLDPLRDDIPQLTHLARVAQPISHVDRIITNDSSQARPPIEIFGAEPERCWCYYFQKADLAKQTGNWQQVAQIGDEVRQLGLKPGDATEWLIFVEGYTNVGRYDDAQKTTQFALQAPDHAPPEVTASGSQTQDAFSLQAILARSALCSLFKRVADTGSQNTAHKAFIADMDSQLSCPAP